MIQPFQQKPFIPDRSSGILEVILLRQPEAVHGQFLVDM